MTRTVFIVKLAFVADIVTSVPSGFVKTKIFVIPAVAGPIKLLNMLSRLLAIRRGAGSTPDIVLIIQPLRTPLA